MKRRTRTPEFSTQGSTATSFNWFMGSSLRILNHRGAIVALFCLLVGTLALVIPIEANDFREVYYLAGRSVLETGSIDYSYWDSQPDDPEMFVNMPILAYLFVPFALFEINIAGFLFLAFEIATYVVAFVIALKFFARTALDSWVLFLLFLFSRHFYTSVQFGQLTILCFLLLVLIYVACQKGWLVSSGLLVTSAFLIKIPTGLLFLYFLCKKQFRVVAVSAFSYAGVALVSILTLGLLPHQKYIYEAVIKNSGSTVLAYNNASVHALVMRFLHPDALFSWNVVRVPPAISIIILLALILLLVYLARTMMQTRLNAPPARSLELSLTLCASLLALPLVWDHYFLFLVLPFYFSCQAIVRGGKRLQDIFIWCPAMVLANLPVLFLINFLSGVGWPDTFLPLLPSAPLAGCAVLMFLLLRQYRRLVSDEASAQVIRERVRPGATAAASPG